MQVEISQEICNTYSNIDYNVYEKLYHYLVLKEAAQPLLFLAPMQIVEDHNNV